MEVTYYNGDTMRFLTKVFLPAKVAMIKLTLYKFISPLGLMFMVAYVPKILAQELIYLPDIQVEEAKTSPVADQIGFRNQLDRTLLEESGKADLSVALRGINSVNISQSNASSTTGLTLRGASGGLGLVTLDGVPLFNSFSGFFPLSHYPLDLLERVDVAQGAGGIHNGSRTLGGSINLVSRDLPADKRFLHTEGGSYGTLRNHLGGGFSNRLGQWTLAAGRTDIFEGVSQAGPENGATERDNFQMSNGLLRWNRDFGQGYVDSSVYFVRAREQSDGPGLLPNRKIGWKDDPNGLAIQETWVAQVHASYQLNDNWQSSLRLGFTQNEATGQIGTKPARSSVDLTSQLWLSHWENRHQFQFDSITSNKINVIWGIDAQQQHANSPKNPYQVTAWTNTVVSPLTRLELEWGNWLADAGVRLDHDAVFGDHTVFNLGGGWRFHPSMLLWLKGGTGYRAPAANERLHPLFGNPTVQPEHNVMSEIGWRWQPSKDTELSVAGYWQDFKNLIVLQQDSQTGISKTGNYAVARVWGSELQVHHAWNEAWRSGFNYTFMDATNPENGLQVAMRPKHQGQLWQEWRILAPLKIRLELVFRDGYWTDPNNMTRIQSVPRLNAQVSYQATSRFRLYVRGENLNDDRTPDLQGFNFTGASVYTGLSLDL